MSVLFHLYILVIKIILIFDEELEVLLFDKKQKVSMPPNKI